MPETATNTTGRACDDNEPARSKVKLARNAKGGAQWEITVVDGSTMESLDELRRIAVAQHLALARERDLEGVA